MHVGELHGHVTFNPLVASSNLARPTKLYRVRTGHMVYIRYRAHSLQLPFTPILWDQMDSLGR